MYVPNASETKLFLTSHHIFADLNVKIIQYEVIEFSPFIGRQFVFKPVSVWCVFQHNKSKVHGTKASFHRQREHNREEQGPCSVVQNVLKGNEKERTKKASRRIQNIQRKHNTMHIHWMKQHTVTWNQHFRPGMWQPSSHFASAQHHSLVLSRIIRHRSWQSLILAKGKQTQLQSGAVLHHSLAVTHLCIVRSVGRVGSHAAAVLGGHP